MRPSARLLTAAALALLSACGQPALIDRTQPNYVRKSDLTQGTWYLKETVVDSTRTPGAAAIVGYGGTLEKVRFEVQEGLLVAYRAYEIAPGADPLVDREKSSLGHVVYRDGKPYKGNPVFAYRIQSHFDRQRQYNSATGEQTNVLEENSSDRPWYEREFMRVDWKVNQVRNLDSDCTHPVHGPLSRCVGGTGASFRYVTEQDQAARDEAMTFERNAKGELTYFDWTTQAIMDPKSVYFPGYGNLPYCLFDSKQDCESSDIRIRTSVRRVDEDHVADYEPLPYGDTLMTKFGFFRHEAYSYSRDYGYTYSGRQDFAMRHDIWARSRTFSKDASGKTVMSTIPVEQRELKPIVYYLTANTPKFLWAAASMRHATSAGLNPDDTIEHSWDLAFRRAVAVPRGLEPSDIPQMFYLCESPVPEGAPAACGSPGTWARIGDLRYNVVPYVEQNAGGLLGLGPSAVDPETAEVVQAAANVYGLGLDTWAGSSMQAMDVLNGDVTLEDLVAGKDIKGYVFARLDPTDPRRPASGPWSSQQGLTSDSTRPMSTFGSLQGKLKDLVQDSRVRGSLPQGGGDALATLGDVLERNPALEEELLSLPEVRLATRALTNQPAFLQKLDQDQAFYRAVARGVLTGSDPITRARAQDKDLVDPALGCFYEYGYADQDYLGVAKRKKALYDARVEYWRGAGSPKCKVQLACTPDELKALARDDVYDSIRREAYRSVAEHEIGHTLGLRHNFIASADALNYQDGYWELRKETIGVDVAGKRVLPITPANLADAAKPNQKQIDAGLYEYTYSSIMDYGARVAAQNKGVGKYDRAAILFAYSNGAEPGWVEVFNTTRTDYAQPAIVVPVDNAAKAFHLRGAHVEIPVMLAEHYTPVSKMYSDRYHYTTLPLHFAEQTGDLPGMLDQGIRRMQDRGFRRWAEVEPQYALMRRVLKEMALDGSSLSTGGYDHAKVAMSRYLALANNHPMAVEVPYMMCTDGEVGANLLCNRNDQGADVYEMTSKWLERVDQDYVFANFRRDRLTYDPWKVAQAKLGRQLGNLPNVYQQWLFNIYWYQDGYALTTEEMDQYFGVGDPIFQNYWTMAVMDSTNHLVQQLVVPSAGYHGRRPDGRWEYLVRGDPKNLRLPPDDEAKLAQTVKTPAGGGYTDLVYVPRGPGRSPYTVYDSQGYDNYLRVNELGQFWDFYAAMMALTASQTNFLGVDRGSDALRYSLPYYITFNRQLAPVFGGFWQEDLTGLSPSLVKQADGTAQVQLPSYLRAEDYITGFSYPLAPAPVKDAAGKVLPAEPVAPVTPWSTRFYAQVMAMDSFTQNYNQEYASFNQVFRLGSGEALTPSPGFDVVTFDDPFGGATYAALKAQSAPFVASAPALVLRGAQWRAKWTQAKTTGQAVDGLTAAQWEGKLRDTVRSLELMRGLYRVFGAAL